MSRNLIESEKNFASSLITALSLLEKTPTRAEVLEKAKNLAATFWVQRVSRNGRR